MKNEHLIGGRELTAEIIQKYINDHPESSEVVYLVDTTDESAQDILKQNGFRYTGKRMVDGKVVSVYTWFRDLIGIYEEMDEFFNRRVEDYDFHMTYGNDMYESGFISLFRDIPESGNRIDVLDLGCGTGAELRFICYKAPNAKIRCIDVSIGMLEKLRELHPEYEKNIEILHSSFLDLEFDEGTFDCIVACSTLHHLLPDDKVRLYKKIRRWMKSNGYLLIRDYVVNDVQEEELKKKYLELVAAGAIVKDKIYHIDLPLTPEHEVELLTEAGFTCTRIEREGENGILLSAVNRINR